MGIFKYDDGLHKHIEQPPPYSNVAQNPTPTPTPTQTPIPKGGFIN